MVRTTSKNIPIIKRYTNNVSLFKQFIFELGLICLIILGFVMFSIEVCRHEIILDPIEVPKDIAELGYTGIVVAEKIADAALNINIKIQELSTQNSWHKEANNLYVIGTNSNIPDILVPGVPYSIRSIARFIRKEFGLSSVYLRGELVHKNGDLVLTLRNLSTSNNIPVAGISKNEKEIEQLLQEGGAKLLQLTTPSATAIYAYHQFRNDLTNLVKRNVNYHDQAVQAFEYCLKYPPATDDTLVYVLWGNALEDLKKPEKAIEKYHEAIHIDKTFVYAYNGLGNALYKRNDINEAIEQYRKAIDIDRKNANAYNGLGNALYKRNDTKRNDNKEAKKKLARGRQLQGERTLKAGGHGRRIQVEY